MTFRVLEPGEWGMIEHEFAAHDVVMPHPNHALIVGAFQDDGKMAGFVVCQTQIHMEPLVLYNPAAARGLIRKAEETLAKMFDKPTYFAFAEGNVAGIAKALGLEEIPYKIFKKEVV